MKLLTSIINFVADLVFLALLTAGVTLVFAAYYLDR